MASEEATYGRPSWKGNGTERTGNEITISVPVCSVCREPFWWETMYDVDGIDTRGIKKGLWHYHCKACVPSRVWRLRSGTRFVP